MKIFALLLLVLWEGAASAAPIYKMGNTVYFVHEPRLEVSLQHLGSDDDYWDLLSLELRYDLNDAAAEAERIKREFPGVRVTKALLGRESNYRLEIPSLGIDVTVDTLAGHEGPYFTASYFVAKRDSRRVREAYRNGDFVRLTGQFRASVPQEILVERAEVPSSVCTLFRDGGDVYGLVRAYPSVEKRVHAAAREKENRERLLRMVMTGCLEVPGVVSVQSFEDLLDLPLYAKRVTESFVSEVKRHEIREIPHELHYRVIRKD